MPAYPCCCKKCCTEHPSPVIVTITGRDGCECYSQEIEMTWNGSSYEGEAVTCDTEDLAVHPITFNCEGKGIWHGFGEFCRLTNPGGGFGRRLSCDPLHIIFEDIPYSDNFFPDQGCCDGYLDIEVTEPPP
jgi:hypothetical protein